MLDEKIPIEKEQDILNVEELKKQVKAWFLVNIFVILLIFVYYCQYIL